MFKQITEDLITFSLFAGAIGTIAKTFLTAPPYFLGITKESGYLVAGQIIFHIRELPPGIGYSILGLLTHFSIGAFLAIGLSYVLLKSGRDFFLLKGAFYGITAWVFLRNVLVGLAVPGGPQAMNLITTVLSLAGHLVYGLVTAYLIARYYRFGFKTR